MHFFGALLALLLWSAGAHAQTCPVPNTFINGTIIDAGQVNANFAALANCATPLPHVASNAALAASPSTTYPHGVWRDDFAPGVGAGPLFYVNNGIGCSAPDNGAQVTGSDGKCWVAQASSGGMDLRQWGVICDNSTDNSTAMQAAWTWAALGLGQLYVPAAALACRYATAVTVTVNSSAQLKARGGGKRSAQLLYTGTSPAVTSGSPATGCALTINLATVTSSVSLDTFWLNTTNAGTANGICISTTTPGGSAETPSDISHVLIGGTSGLATYFLNAIIVTGNDGLNINDLTEFGDNAGTVSTGLWEQGNTGTTFKYSINLQVVNSVFSNNKYGYIYGSFVQGPSFVNSQFQNSTTGVFSAASEGGTLAGLFLSNVQFGTSGRCIDFETAVIQITISGGVCLGGANGDYTIYLPAEGGGSITGMIIAPQVAGVTGIFATGGSAVPLTIDSNLFQTANGISLGPTASNVHIGCANGFNLSGGATNDVLGVGAANNTAGSIVNTVCGTSYSGGGGTTQISAGQTAFVGIGLSTTSEIAVAMPAPRTGKLRNLYVVTGAAPGVGQTYTATFRVAGSSTLITCTVSGGSANTCSDILHENYVPAPLNVMDLQVVASAGAATANVNWGILQDTQ